MTRTSAARERMLTLYRGGTASADEVMQARAEYDAAAIAEGVRAFTLAAPPLTDDQRHALAVLLAPAPHHADPRHAERAATAC